MKKLQKHDLIKAIIPATCMISLCLTGCGSGDKDTIRELTTEAITTESTTADASQDTTEQNTTEQEPVGDDTSDQSTSETTGAETDTSQPAAESSDLSSYSSILQQYRTALQEDWDFDTLMNNGLNYLCAYHKGTGLDDIGYSLYDIDNNGTPELLIGELGQTNRGGDVYDIYTLSDGNPSLVAQSGERDMFTVCEGGKISEVGSGGAAHTYFQYYDYKDGNCVLIEAVVIDGELDPENPYFYTTADTFDTSTYTPITESEGDDIAKKYSATQITFTPFREYQ